MDVEVEGFGRVVLHEALQKTFRSSRFRVPSFNSKGVGYETAGAIGFGFRTDLDVFVDVVADGSCRVDPREAPHQRLVNDSSQK